MGLLPLVAGLVIGLDIGLVEGLPLVEGLAGAGLLAGLAPVQSKDDCHR